MSNKESPVAILYVREDETSASYSIDELSTLAVGAHDLYLRPSTGQVDQSAQRREDLKEFMKAAITGLCANSARAFNSPEFLAEEAAKIAEAALAELERRG